MTKRVVQAIRRFHITSDAFCKSWAQRHITDPYVRRARIESYRCRSAFKLLEMDDKYRLISPGDNVLELGASPGSWTQVLVKRTNSMGTDPYQPTGRVIALDRGSFPAVEGACCLSETDIVNPDTIKKIGSLLEGKKINSVFSDMAPNASGVRELDVDGITMLCMLGLKLSVQVLEERGLYLCKMWDGRTVATMKTVMKDHFQIVRQIKPAASRSESTEIYILGKGFNRSRSAWNGESESCTF